MGLNLAFNGAMAEPLADFRYGSICCLNQS
jgi:hypothetical protein